MDIVSTIISTIQAVVRYAPDAVKAFNTVKQFITGLFGAGVISAEQQDKLMALCDATLDAHQAGPPPGWSVDPDPDGVVNEGKIRPITPTYMGELPPGVEPYLIITRIESRAGGGQLLCNDAGDCWSIKPDTNITPTLAGAGQTWQVGALTFFITPQALAMIAQ